MPYIVQSTNENGSPLEFRHCRRHRKWKGVPWNRGNDWNSLRRRSYHHGWIFYSLHFVKVVLGFGHHLMKPILRELYRPSLTKDEAIEMLKTCLSMGYYRDATTINKFQIAVCSSEGLTKFLKSLSNRFKGITISEPFALDAKWDYEKFVHPTLNAPTSF